MHETRHVGREKRNGRGRASADRYGMIVYSGRRNERTPPWQPSRLVTFSHSSLGVTTLTGFNRCTVSHYQADCATRRHRCHSCPNGIASSNFVGFVSFFSINQQICNAVLIPAPSGTEPYRKTFTYW